MRYSLVIESVISVNQMGARREREGGHSKIMHRFFFCLNIEVYGDSK